MKQLDIRFTQERENKKAEYQLQVISRLQERLPKRIAEAEFKDVSVRIRFGSAGVDITGFKDKEEKKRFSEFLEELWNDSSLVED
ncbi:MAG: DinI-like family protein [Lonepinella koalarum]|nr:DinI-like family protein [Lonepinella koalarum]